MLQLQEALPTAAQGERRPEGGDNQPHHAALSPPTLLSVTVTVTEIITLHTVDLGSGDQAKVPQEVDYC